MKTWKYEAENDDELTFDEDTVIYVVAKNAGTVFNSY